MAVESPPSFLQSGSYSAEQTRRSISGLLSRGSTIGSIVGGIVAAGDCALTAPGSGMSVNVAPGEIWVPGSSSSTQGGYYCRVSSTTNLVIAAANGSLPRIDTVVAQVQDAAYTGSTNSFQLAVVTGTATSGANLTNLTGAGSVPASSLVVGYVLVPAAASNIISGDLLTSVSRVVFGLGWLPVVLTATNLVAAANTSVVASASCVVNLPPTPVKGSWVSVAAGYSASGASAVSVGTTDGSHIYGGGQYLTTGFVLGSPGANAALQFDGTNWSVQAGQQDTGWATLTIPTGWSAVTSISSNTWNAPAAKLVGNVVRLRGYIQNTSGGTAAFSLGTFPSGMTPATTHVPQVLVNTAGTFSTMGMFIAPSGFGGANMSNLAWFSLENVSYDLS